MRLDAFAVVLLITTEPFLVSGATCAAAQAWLKLEAIAP
jgi:hypothetical protein